MQPQLMVAIPVCLLAACAPLKPTPITMPDAAQHSEYRKLLGYTGKRTIADLKAALENYEGAWQKATQLARDNKYWSNELSFVGAIATAVAGIRKSQEGILIGGGTVAASSAYSAHYNFDVQSANYQNAKKGMRCIRRELEKIDQGTWDIAFDPASGGFNLDTSDETLREVAGIPDAVVGAMEDIVDKLDTAQASVALAVPSPSALRESFTKYTDAAKEADQKAKQLKIAMPNLAQKHATGSIQANALTAASQLSEETLKKLILVKPAIRNCVAIAGA
jgi:hypothetical protein